MCVQKTDTKADARKHGPSSSTLSRLVTIGTTQTHTGCCRVFRWPRDHWGIACATLSRADALRVLQSAFRGRFDHHHRPHGTIRTADVTASAAMFRPVRGASAVASPHLQGGHAVTELSNGTLVSGMVASTCGSTYVTVHQFSVQLNTRQAWWVAPVAATLPKLRHKHWPRSRTAHPARQIACTGADGKPQIPSQARPEPHKERIKWNVTSRFASPGMRRSMLCSTQRLVLRPVTHQNDVGCASSISEVLGASVIAESTWQCGKAPVQLSSALSAQSGTAVK